MRTVKILSLLSICGIAAWVALSNRTAEAGLACCGASESFFDAKFCPGPKSAATAKKSSVASIEEQKKNYPLDVCVVMGSKLGEHGEVVDHVYKSRLVRLCCKGCVNTFKKDPATYLAKLDEAVKVKAESEPIRSEKDAKSPTTAPKSKDAPAESHSGHAHH
jgi:hypothetical protein